MVYGVIFQDVAVMAASSAYHNTLAFTAAWQRFRWMQVSYLAIVVSVQLHQTSMQVLASLRHHLIFGGDNDHAPGKLLLRRSLLLVWLIFFLFSAILCLYRHLILPYQSPPNAKSMYSTVLRHPRCSK